jgi:diaminohydroxyphosphoribosylaminopyrimidine deaminase/5-amino-6-(5-phosphoribosylamino)uracil reductase
VVLAPHLNLDPAARVFVREDPSLPPTRVYVAMGCPGAALARFRDVAEVVPVGSSAAGLDLAAVLADLHGVGVQSVLVEGGGKTSGTFVGSGLVDDVVLFIARRLFGSGDATPVVDVPAVAGPGEAWRVEQPTIVPLGEDVIVFGRLGRP